MYRIIYSTILFFMSCCTIAAANSYYVAPPPAGSNDNPGTIESPLATIQGAVDKMQEGDICYIRQGIYRETIKPISSSISGIQLKAFENEKVKC